MTEQQTKPDRAAAARAARSLRSQQRTAALLETAGWTCTPPTPTPNPESLWTDDAAREIADLVDGRTLTLGGGVVHGHDRRWDAYAVDAEGFRPGPEGVANRVTLICHDRPSDPVVVEILVRVVTGQVP